MDEVHPTDHPLDFLASIRLSQFSVWSGAVMLFAIVAALIMVLFAILPFWGLGWGSTLAVCLVPVALCFSVFPLVPIILFFERVTQYSGTAERSSELAKRLWSIASQYEIEMNTVFSALPESETHRTHSSLELLKNKDNQEKIKRLIGADDFLEFERNVHRLRRNTQRISAEVDGADTSSSRQVWKFIQNSIWDLDNVFASGARTGSHETHRINSVPSDEILSDLSTTVAKLDRSPWPSLLAFSKWETEPGADYLITEAEAAIKSIEHHTRNLAKHAALPNFTKSVAVVVWRQNLPTPAAKVQSLPKRASDLGSMESNLIHLSRESVVSSIHRRQPVQNVDVETNGKYRGVCQLSMVFSKVKTNEFINTAFGSGWLIDPLTVVTAGHNVYDPKSREYASEVIVRIGVMDDNFKHRRVEERVARWVVLHLGYYELGLAKHDMAVIELESAFDHVQCIDCVQAPVSATAADLQVVGYPGDLPLRGKKSLKGCVMYLSQGKITYDLSTAHWRLRHNLNTFEGNSGGPILKVDSGSNTLKAIGIHCYGAGSSTQNLNSGTPLGHNGNDVEAFVEAIWIAEHGLATAQKRASIVKDIAKRIPGLKMVQIPKP